MSPKLDIRALEQQDFIQVKSIYQQGIETKNATFETQAPEWEDWNSKFLLKPRFVAEVEQIIIGWAALSAISTRPVYSGVCEVSVYVHEDYRGMGVGRSLLKKLIDFSESNNIWTLQAGIFPENIGSIKIHKDLGFRHVGRREKIGKMGDTWRDTVLLERRSPTIR
jgi:phosphinothricin acetyltransferase